MAVEGTAGRRNRSPSRLADPPGRVASTLDRALRKRAGCRRIAEPPTAWARQIVAMPRNRQGNEDTSLPAEDGRKKRPPPFSQKDISVNFKRMKRYDVQTLFFVLFPSSGGVHCPRSPPASTAAVIALMSFAVPTNALSFNWQFSNDNGFPVSGGIVTGPISGLLDNTSNQATALSVAVTSAPNSPAGGWSNDWICPTTGGTGFSIVSGVVTSGEAHFRNSSHDNLYFGSGATCRQGCLMTRRLC